MPRFSAIFRYLVLASSVLAIAWQTAQAGDGGSTYSLLGIGDLRYLPSVRAAGMGYTGLGVIADDYINSLSPAAASRINRTRLDASIFYEGFNSTDGTRSRYLAKADFGGAMLAVPVAQSQGIVITAGFMPYSKVNYDSYSQGAYQNGPDSLGYTIHYLGSGGITRGTAGLSWTPFGGVTVGAALNYLFGSVDRSSVVTLTGGFAGGTTTHTQTVSGVTGTFAAQLTGFGRISPALEPLSLGMVITSRGNLHSNDQASYVFAAELDTAEGVANRIVLPIAYGVGSAYVAGNRYLLAADYSAQPWSKSEINGITPYGIRNAQRFGIGAERMASRERATSWLDRIAYRLGYTYDATYYALNGTTINAWSLTGGLGLPFSGESRMNLALEYGVRGTIAGGLVKDKFLRILISINLSEQWFVPYPEE